MQSELTYSGLVTITIKGRPGITRTNQGTTVLFKTIYEILTNTTVESSLPSFMSIIDSKGEDIINTTDYSDYENDVLVSSPLIISDRGVLEDGCVFKSLLTHNQTLSNVSDVAECFVLLLNSKKQILAFVKKDFDDISAVFNDANSQAVIEWKMSFNNKESE